jgi:sulfite reductase (NADPH) hemoprotein beta-component
MSLDEVEPAALSAGRRSGKKAVGGKIATGNRLRDGVVVYLNRAGGWAAEVSEARVAHTDEEEAALKAALDQAVKSNQLIDAAVIDTRVDDTAPARLREQIRAVGPTVRPDLARRAPL